MLKFQLADNQNKVTRLWRLYLWLALLQSLATLGLVFSMRYEGTNDSLIPLSRAQILTCLAILFVILAVIYLLVEIGVKPARTHRRTAYILTFLDHPRNFSISLLLSAVVFLLCSLLITLIPELEEPFTLAIFKRLLPICLLAAGLGLQTLAVLLVLRHGIGFGLPRPGNMLFFTVLILIGVVFGLWIGMVVPLIPKISRIVGWNALGVPLLELQVLLAWCAGMGMLAGSIWANRREKSSSWIIRLKPGQIDLILSLLIWLATILVWQLIPVHPNWFLTNKEYPNREYYPSSDARIYDMVAQSNLVGNGYRFVNDFNVRRPLHGMYLTLLHLAEGQDYASLVSLQVVILALFPVLIYLITRSIHNRVSGVMAAILILLREANAISLSGNITTANAKLLMVDLPTAMVLAGFFCLAILWLDRKPGNILPALIAGQALGLAMLIRLETFVMLAAVVWVVWVVFKPKPQFLLGLRQLAIFLLGIGIVLSPWVVRNWKLTGQVYLNEPNFRYGIIYQRFLPAATPTPSPAQSSTPPVSSTPELNPFPAVTPIAPSKPVAPAAEEVENQGKQYLSQALQHPSQSIRYTFAHYLNSQLQSLLIFPATFRGIDSITAFVGHHSLKRLWFECCSTTSHIRRLPYWQKWDGNLPLQSIVPLIINCVILAAGIQVAWNRRRWAGLLPLTGAIIYLAANAVFRNSGGRYILPVDWVMVIYFSIGLAHLSVSLIDYLAGGKVVPESPPHAVQSDQNARYSSGWWAAVILGATFLAIGIAIPVMEKSIPVRYPDDRKAQMLAALFASAKLAPAERDGLQSFIDNGAVSIAGRILYPQYYAANSGSLGKEDSPIEPLPYPRLVFSLAGKDNYSFLLPTQNRPPIIPNALDGLVIACPPNQAVALAVFSSADQLQQVVLNSQFPNGYTCPLPAGSGDNP